MDAKITASKTTTIDAFVETITAVYANTDLKFVGGEAYFETEDK